MNKDLITLNEVLNSGSSIDLYQEENTGLWATYGYSAYLLFHQNAVSYTHLTLPTTPYV